MAHAQSSSGRGLLLLMLVALVAVTGGCFESSSQQGEGGGEGDERTLFGPGAGDGDGDRSPGDMEPRSMAFDDGSGDGSDDVTVVVDTVPFVRDDGSWVEVREFDGRTIVMLTTAPFELAPGEERFMCQNFANPVGRDLELSQTESVMTAGSHHLFAFTEGGAMDGPLSSCSGLEFGPSVHGASSIEKVITYPPGVARFLSGGDGIRIQMHYFNASDGFTEGQATVVLTESGDVEPLRAASLFMNNLNINVPAQAPGQATKTCTLPYDVQLLGVSSHMHRFGILFEATLDDGQLLYATERWEDPQPALFDPARSLRAGSTITFRCDYLNTSDRPLSFGESAETNEMCILSGVFYPSPDGQGIVCM